MRNLSWDDFRDSVGVVYSVESPSGPLALRLDLAAPLAGSGREGGGFRLELVGPPDPVLPQAIYRFSADSVEPFEIFIVPVERGADGTRYEAIFF